MKKKLSCSLMLFAFGAMLWSQSAVPPIETDFKTDRCLFCKMVVDDRSYAAQIVTSKGASFFDDYGCLVQSLRAGMIPADEVKASYVRNVAGDAWVLVDEATWVLTKEVRTPMGYGLHAFEDEKAALDFALLHEGARLVRYADLDKEIPPPKHKMKM